MIVLVIDPLVWSKSLASLPSFTAGSPMTPPHSQSEHDNDNEHENDWGNETRVRPMPSEPRSLAACHTNLPIVLVIVLVLVLVIDPLVWSKSLASLPSFTAGSPTPLGR